MRLFLLLPLLLLSACGTISNGVTCTYANGILTCGPVTQTQDLLAQGAEDEKPDRPS